MSVSANASQVMTRQWRLALADSGLGEENVHLIAVPGLPLGPKVPKAATYVAGCKIEESIPEEAILSGETLREANSPGCIDKIRVAMFVGYPEEKPVDVAILAGKLRHELRHAEQRRSEDWDELYALECLTVEVSDRKRGCRSGERVFYTQIPTELDANAAAASFLRRHHPEVMEGVLKSEEAAPLALSATPPEAIEDLPVKCVAYLFIFREVAEALRGDDGLSLEEELSAISARAVTIWRQLAG